jgi:uncharacterized protein
MPIPVSEVEGHTRAWLESFVVGLNLCPFARPMLNTDKLRISVSNAESAEGRARDFLGELDLLQRSSEEQLATTLVVFPASLASFEDYLDFLEEAQTLLLAAGLDGTVQLASFHPDYQFEGDDATAPGNFSNRSPYPVIHLLRESMLTRALSEFPDPQKIPEKNIRVLESIGEAELRRRWLGLFG